jgi:hypothetical protein
VNGVVDDGIAIHVERMEDSCGISELVSEIFPITYNIRMVFNNIREVGRYSHLCIDSELEGVFT